MRARRRRLLLAAAIIGCSTVGCGASGAQHPAPVAAPTTTSSFLGLASTTTTSVPGTKPAKTTTSRPTVVSVAAPTKPVPPLPAVARTRVQVAHVWHAPSSPRSIDQPALQPSVDMRAWLAGLTTSQREGLTDRVDTQVVLGDAVLVVGVQGGWANVRVTDQPHPADGRGYPGWIPLVQLTFDPPPSPAAPARAATVVSRTAWLSDPADGHHVLEVSIGTRLPVQAAEGASVDVVTPDGATLRAASSDVSITAPDAPALGPSADDVVRVAELFDGLPYLWGGLSGFGVDCSGLTYMAYRLHGVTIPRDSRVQATAGSPVARDALRPGDVVFFAKNGTVHHNGMYVGSNTMLHASHTGTPVRTTSLDTQPYATEYQGARRFIP